MAISQHKSYLKTYLKNRKEENEALKSRNSIKSNEKSENGTRPKTLSTKQSIAKGSDKDARHLPGQQKSPSHVANKTKTKITTSARERVACRQNQHAMKTAYSRSGSSPIDWLPDELILEIFSYLSPQDLLTCGTVCKRWYKLGADNLLWQTIYKYYASHTAKKQKSVKIPKNPSASFWKKSCVQRGAEYRNMKALKIVQQKRIHPFTGLPKGTQEAIQKAGLKWILSFVDDDSQEHTFTCEDAYYFSMSVCVRWYSFELPGLTRIRKLRIYSGNPIFFDERGQALQNSPLQRSILYEHDFKLGEIISKSSVLGSDSIINVYDLTDGLFIATWKDESNLAFISMSFHRNSLIERCLHGTTTRPWMPSPHKPFWDDIDRKYGLHSYSCTLELRNMRTSFWSQQFLNLHCLETFQDGYAVLQLIDPERSFERSWISKKISLPWKTEVLKGVVKDVCLLDVTLLDDQRKPMWCSCGLTKVRPAENTPSASYEYNGDYFSIIYTDKDLGKVIMAIVWEETSKMFYITSLQVHLSLKLINYWFGTQY